MMLLVLVVMFIMNPVSLRSHETAIAMVFSITLSANLEIVITKMIIWGNLDSSCLSLISMNETAVFFYAEARFITVL